MLRILMVIWFLGSTFFPSTASQSNDETAEILKNKYLKFAQSNSLNPIEKFVTQQKDDLNRAIESKDEKSAAALSNQIWYFSSFGIPGLIEFQGSDNLTEQDWKLVGLIKESFIIAEFVRFTSELTLPQNFIDSVANQAKKILLKADDITKNAYKLHLGDLAIIAEGVQHRFCTDYLYYFRGGGGCKCCLLPAGSIIKAYYNLMNHPLAKNLLTIDEDFDRIHFKEIIDHKVRKENFTKKLYKILGKTPPKMEEEIMEDLYQSVCENDLFNQPNHPAKEIMWTLLCGNHSDDYLLHNPYLIAVISPILQDEKHLMYEQAIGLALEYYCTKKLLDDQNKHKPIILKIARNAKNLYSLSAIDFILNNKNQADDITDEQALILKDLLQNEPSVNVERRVSILYRYLNNLINSKISLPENIKRQVLDFIINKTKLGDYNTGIIEIIFQHYASDLDDKTKESLIDLIIQQALDCENYHFFDALQCMSRQKETYKKFQQKLPEVTIEVLSKDTQYKTFQMDIATNILKPAGMYPRIDFHDPAEELQKLAKKHVVNYLADYKNIENSGLFNYGGVIAQDWFTPHLSNLFQAIKQSLINDDYDHGNSWHTVQMLLSGGVSFQKTKEEEEFIASIESLIWQKVKKIVNNYNLYTSNTAAVHILKNLHEYSKNPNFQELINDSCKNCVDLLHGALAECDIANNVKCILYYLNFSPDQYRYDYSYGYHQDKDDKFLMIQGEFLKYLPQIEYGFLRYAHTFFVSTEHGDEYTVRKARLAVTDYLLSKQATSPYIMKKTKSMEKFKKELVLFVQKKPETTESFDFCALLFKKRQYLAANDVKTISKHIITMTQKKDDSSYKNFYDQNIKEFEQFLN